MVTHLFKILIASLALIFSAYTSPEKLSYTAQFKFCKIDWEEDDVKNPENWEFDGTSLSCPSDLTKACAIIVSDIYYHLDAEGTPILNNKEFYQSDRTGTEDEHDEEMIIDTEVGNVLGQYRVVNSFFTTAVSINNRGN